MEFRNQILMRFSNQANSKGGGTLTWKHPLTFRELRLIECAATLRNYDFGQIVFAILSLPTSKGILNRKCRDGQRTKSEFKGRGGGRVQKLLREMLFVFCKFVRDSMFYAYRCLEKMKDEEDVCKI